MAAVRIYSIAVSILNCNSIKAKIYIIVNIYYNILFKGLFIIKKDILTWASTGYATTPFSLGIFKNELNYYLEYISSQRLSEDMDEYTFNVLKKEILKIIKYVNEFIQRVYHDIICNQKVALKYNIPASDINKQLISIENQQLIAKMDQETEFRTEMISLSNKINIASIERLNIHIK